MAQLGGRRGLIHLTGLTLFSGIAKKELDYYIRLSLLHMIHTSSAGWCDALKKLKLTHTY